MDKIKPAEGYPPEEGHYLRGNDYSPVAVVVILTYDYDKIPKEIEDFLYTHPAVSDVQVIGVPDHKYGEELCACIILHENDPCTEETIRQYCKEHISHNKVPRYVRFFQEFPMTASGKAQKFKLREFMREELNLKEIA